MEMHDFINNCSDAIIKNNPSLLEYTVGRFAEYCFKEPTDNVADDELVDYLNDTFRSTLFHKMDGSWHLLIILEFNWSSFTDIQKKLILNSIEHSFDKFSDPMSWFVLSEVLGEYYCCEQSFALLKRFTKLPDEGPRSLVPHGLEHIAKTTTNESLQSNAIKEIANMQNDKSDIIRKEVLNSIQRLRFLKKM